MYLSELLISSVFFLCAYLGLRRRIVLEHSNTTHTKKKKVSKKNPELKFESKRIRGHQTNCLLLFYVLLAIPSRSVRQFAYKFGFQLPISGVRYQCLDGWINHFLRFLLRHFPLFPSMPFLSERKNAAFRLQFRGPISEFLLLGKSVCFAINVEESKTVRNNVQFLTKRSWEN